MLSSVSPISGGPTHAHQSSTAGKLDVHQERVDRCAADITRHNQELTDDIMQGLNDPLGLDDDQNRVVTKVKNYLTVKNYSFL